MRRSSPERESTGACEPLLVTVVLKSILHGVAALLFVANAFAANATLPRATEEELRPLREWNRARKLPTQAAIRRPLPEALEASFTRRSLSVHSIAVMHAHQISLHLMRVDLASDAQLTVRTDFESFGPVAAASLLHGGEIYTPPLRGDEITLIVHSRQGGFRIEQIIEWFELDDESMPRRDDRIEPFTHVPCPYDDATCVTSSTLPAIDAVRKATARVVMFNPSGGALCTGALIRDTDDVDSAAYFLTASHCIANALDAGRAVFRWEYRSTACNATSEQISGQTTGATILARNPSSDSILLRLGEAPPAGSAFLDWTATPPPAETPLFRVSHPGGLPQKLSASNIKPDAASWCGPIPFENAIISQPTRGRFTGGSSGAPAVNSDGRIVGQLYGDCFNEATYDPCHYDTYYAVDGAFSASYPAFAPWLSPPSCPTPYIIIQPQSSTTQSGGYAAGYVAASRRAPFTYQWYRGERGDTSRPFPDATMDAVALGPFTESTKVWVRVSNSCGSTDSDAATITVTAPCVAPNITMQPTSRTARTGELVTLQIAAQGNAPITYQWYRRVNGEVFAIDGATSATLTTTVTVTTSFFAILRNECGQTTSDAATVTVVPGKRARAARRS